MARARRRRIAVAVASAGVLIAGIGLTSGEQPRDPVAPVPGPPSDPHADWAARAQVTLASLQKQLDRIVETEQVWTSEIAEQYDGQDTPPAVTAMLAQKAELEQQIATLTAQLAVAEELHRVREQVSGSEDRLAALDEVIDEHIPERAQARTPEQQALLDQRDLLAASLADAHADAARLAEGVDAAQAAPLPTPVDHSTPLVEAVRDLDDDGDREGPGSVELPPAVAFGRDEETRPSSPPTSGEPEDPEDSQPTDQPDEQGGPPPGDSPPPASPPPAHEPPAEDLGDTVDNTLDGVTGLVGNDDEGAGDKGAGDNDGEGNGAGAGDERSGSAEDRGGPGKNDRPDLGDRVDDTLDPVTEPITDLIGGDDSDEPDDSDGPDDNEESDDSDDPASSDDDRRDNDERDGVSGGDDQSGRDDRDDQSAGRDDGASPGTDDVRDGENSPDDAAGERGSEGPSAADLSDLDLDLNEVNDRIGSLAGDLADDIVDTLIPLDVEAVVGVGMSDFADSEGTEEEDSTAAEDENSDDDTPSGNSDSDSGDDEPDRSGSDDDGSGDGGDDGDEGDRGDAGDSSGSSGDNGSADEGGDSQDDGDTNSDNDGSDA